MAAIIRSLVHGFGCVWMDLTHSVRAFFVPDLLFGPGGNTVDAGSNPAAVTAADQPPKNL